VGGAGGAPGGGERGRDQCSCRGANLKGEGGRGVDWVRRRGGREGVGRSLGGCRVRVGGTGRQGERWEHLHRACTRNPFPSRFLHPSSAIRH
jgi:hypothetical protein